ncbi:MAG: MOP flippase family protein [Dehalococcoidales bacterium]|nr:MAG: MOP flippase family protein [Dehalococcoidales bacterium]
MSLEGIEPAETNGSLTRSVVHGAAWLGISQVFTQVFHLVSMVFLARLLLPDDFGITAMAAIITSLVSEVLSLGFNRAIIQRKEVTPSHLSTAFWIQWSLGIVFCLVTVAVSPLVASFFNNEMVGPVLAVASISFVIAPLGAVHGALLRKKLDFLRFTVADIGAAITYLAVAVPMAFAGFGVWSIVVGGLASASCQVIIRWIMCRWRPSFTFSRSSFRDMRSFGFSVTGISLIQYINRRLDYLIIGRFLSAANVGFYNLGLRTLNYPVGGLRFIISRVGLPAFSQVQDEDVRLRRGFLKSVQWVSIIGLPIFTGMAIVAPELIRVAFGEQWTPAIVPMQLLCAASAASLMSETVPSLVFSKGKPGAYLKLAIARVIFLVPGLLLGAQFGIEGVAISVATISVIFTVARQILASRLIGIGFKTYLVVMRHAAIGCIIMAIVLLAFRYATSLFDFPDIPLLISSVLLGVIVYFITLKLIRTDALDEMTELALEIIKPPVRSVMARIPLLRKGVPATPNTPHKRVQNEEGGSTNA